MFLSDNIDLGKPDKYILSVRIVPDGFSFLISDVDDKNCFCYRETTFVNDLSLLQNIQRIVFDYNFLTENFRETNVMCLSETYTLFPDEYYDAKLIKKLYNFSRENESSYVLTDPQTLNGTRLVFSLPDELYLFLNRSLYIPRFRHACSLYMDYFRKKINKPGHNSMTVYFHDNFMDIICFDDQEKILLTQSYYKEHSQDVLFYILSIWEKLKFDQRNDMLFIYGYFPDNGMESLLKEYIQNVHNIGTFDQIADFGAGSQEIPLDLLLLSE